MLLLACSSSSDGGHPIHRLFMIYYPRRKRKRRGKVETPESESDCCCVLCGDSPLYVFPCPPFFFPAGSRSGPVGIICNLRESVTSVGTSPAMEEAKRKV